MELPISVGPNYENLAEYLLTCIDLGRDQMNDDEYQQVVVALHALERDLTIMSGLFRQQQ